MPSNFMNLFGKSPIKPIQEHIEKAHECAVELGFFFQAVTSENWDEARAIQEKIARLENEADDLKRNIRLSLPKSLYLPVARTDLLELLSIQDHIANTAKDIAGRIVGRTISFPKPIIGQLLAYVQSSIDTSAQALKALQELDELMEVGFRGREVVLVENMIKELDQLETNNDLKERKIRHSLFEIERELHPIDVMFMYSIIDQIGTIADKAQSVGDRLQILLAR